jgi:acyl-CoA synthetase (NDP forming)
VTRPMTIDHLQRRSQGVAAALNPASIAIIGASDNPHKVGGRPLMYLARFGYHGRLYPINPRRVEVQGFKAYPDVSALPEAPDLCIIAVPAEQTKEAVDACAARGVKAAIVMASGFGETADAAGKLAEDAIVQSGRAAGMRIVGPNSQGLANFGTGVVASFSTMFLEVKPVDGPVAIISQSGVMSVVPYGLVRSRGIGVRHAHATGNEADVSLAELAVAVIEDPAVRLLLLYIESIRDPGSLALAAQIARDRDIPIVAVKSGRTVRGQAAARSHTGALANDDRVVDAFFSHHGIWRAPDIDGLVRTAELYLKGWRPRRRSLVVVSNSGASGVMAADTAQEFAIPLTTLADKTVTALAAQLPSFASVTNPIDITAALLTDSRLLSNLLPILAEETSADLFLLAIPVAGDGYDLDAFARDTAAFERRVQKPVVVAAPQQRVIERFREAGVASFTSQSEAIAALAQLVEHVQLMTPRTLNAVVDLKVQLPPGETAFLNESESLHMLQSFGLPVVPHVFCRSEDDARIAFRRFGGPVVVKACSDAIPHKSDYGLVVLNVASESEVATAFTSLSAQLGDLRSTRDGVIVAPMTRGRREIALGAKVDRTFGPVVMLGDGGRYVETLGDFALLLPPFGLEEARQALLSLRMAPFFQGVRGEPALDIDAICEAAVRLGQIISVAVEQIAFIDLNPVMVGTPNEGVVIVDALVGRAD